MEEMSKADWQKGEDCDTHGGTSHAHELHMYAHGRRGESRGRAPLRVCGSGLQPLFCFGVLLCCCCYDSGRFH